MAKEYPCIITLDPSIGIITGTQDKVAYIIRQFFGTPGRYSDTWRDEVISFRELKSKYNGDVETIRAHSEDALSTVIKRLLPADDVQVSCTLEHYSDIRYTLVINVLISSPVGIYEPLLTTANVYVDNDEFKIKLRGDSN